MEYAAWLEGEPDQHVARGSTVAVMLDYRSEREGRCPPRCACGSRALGGYKPSEDSGVRSR